MWSASFARPGSSFSARERPNSSRAPRCGRPRTATDTNCAARESTKRGVSLEGPRWAKAADLSRVSCPVKIVGSDPVVPFSFLPTVDLREILAIDYDFVPDTTHLLQLEQPADVRRGNDAVRGAVRHRGFLTND